MQSVPAISGPLPSSSASERRMSRGSGQKRWVSSTRRPVRSQQVCQGCTSITQGWQAASVSKKSTGTFSGAQCGLLVREPVGVVGAIIPWNAPIALTAVKIAPALLAGCTVVVKASPEAPGHALIMAEVCEAVGLPRGVINVVTAARVASEALVRHPGVDKIAFTGSTATGKKIASILSGRMARCTLELGGKSAAIILDDYDIETAAKTIAATACDLTGQVCASLTRMVVSRSRHDELVEALSASLKKSLSVIRSIRRPKWGLSRPNASAMSWSVILKRGGKMASRWPQAAVVRGI